MVVPALISPAARLPVSPWSQPALRYGLLGFGASAALTLWLTRWGQPPHVLIAWWIAVSAVTFLVFGYDKAIARWNWTRVPERILLLLVLSGGTLGAAAAMSLFRHKTVKASFRSRFWGAVALQLLLLGGWLAKIQMSG